MNHLKFLTPVMALLLLAGPAPAQDETHSAAGSDDREALDEREDEVMRRLSAAEARMAEAAREIAELTSKRLPEIRRLERQIEIIGDDKPRLGVTIGGDDEGPVEGVRVLGVTPGSAASEAGIRAGDIITSINAESLGAGDSDAASDRLLEFMQGVDEGDTLDIEYLRDGKVGKLEVEPRPGRANRFVFGGPGPAGIRPVPGVAEIHRLPRVADGPHERFVFNWMSDTWGDMELVELNEGLGRYFGTDEGLLVVSAPRSSAFKLEDGDVIQKIDGREPASVRHAMRILGSYQAGEQFRLEIMRDRKRRTLDVAIPDDRSSHMRPGPGRTLSPSAVPGATRPPPPAERT